MRAAILTVPLGLAIGWFGSATFKTAPSSEALPFDTTDQPSLLSDQAAFRTGMNPWIPDESLSGPERLLALAYGAPMDSSTFPRRLREWASLPSNQVNHAALVLLIEEWVQHDPEEAFTQCQRLEDSLMRYRALSEVRKAWMKTDPEAVIARALAIPQGFEDRQRLIGDLIVQLRTVSPQRALELAESEGIQRHGQLSAAYETLAKQDLPAAIARLTDSNDAEAWIGVLSVWLESDPTAAIEQLAANRELSRFRVRDLLRDLMPKILADNPLDTFELLSTSLPSETWREIRATFAKTWFETDANAAMDWVAEVQDDSARDSMTKAIAIKLTEDDPVAAFKYLQEQGVLAALAQVAYYWGEQDWVAAFEYVTTTRDDAKGQAHAASGLFSTMPPSMGMEEIHALLSLTEQQQLRANVTELLPRLEQAEIASMLESYPRSVSSAVESHVVDLVQNDPQGAVELYSRLPEHRRNPRQLSEMIVKWSANDPGGASEWLASLPEGQERTYGYLNHINALARSHPERALEFVDQLPEGDLQSKAILEYAEIIGPFAPEASVEAVLKTEDSKLIQTTMERWHQLQPAAARERLAEFDSDLRKSIEERFEMNDQWRALGSSN